MSAGALGSSLRHSNGSLQAACLRRRISAKLIAMRVSQVQKLALP